MSRSYIVVGAGIGGLAAALALQRTRARVRVFEQAPELSEVGAGLSITPNAGNAIIALGLGAELERIGSTPTSGAIRHYQTGATLVALPQDDSRERYGVPLFHVHRADLQRSLEAAVRTNDRDAIQVGKSLASITQTGSSVHAQFADGSSADADALIGCDGARSTVRSKLFESEEPRFIGFVAWRGLIPADAAPASLDAPMSMTVGPRRMLMRYPLRGGSLVNIVAIARRDRWTEEGWSVRADQSELLDEFCDFEPQSRELLAAIPADRCFKWGLFDRDPLRTWTAGRCMLLGDAAHPMPPFAGQGAAMALEDAVALGRAVETTSDIAAASYRYESARQARVRHVLRMSRARADLYFAPDPEAQVRALAAGMAELRTLYDAETLSVPGNQA